MGGLREALLRGALVSRRGSQKDSSGIAELLLVLACFFLSGFAALLYQTAWLKKFGVLFGTSEIAVAAVLSAYMGGLAVGSALAGRFLGNIRRPVLVYGVLEGAIALAALAVPALLFLAKAGYIGLLGDQPAPPDATSGLQAAYFLTVTFLVLLIPTACMGATLPLLAKYAVRTNKQIGPRVGLLYGVNTAGAIAGTVCAGFFLLPRFGLNMTVFAGVGANFLVFLLAVWLVRSSSPAEADPPNKATHDPSLGFWSEILRPLVFGWLRGGVKEKGVYNASGWVYVLIFLSGAISFTYEVMWTRLLSHVLGGSLYAFTTMLASFLTGIMIGGWMGGRLAANRSAAPQMFALAQVLIAIATVGAFYFLTGNPPVERGVGPNAMLSMLVMVPSTIFIGATFPLAVRMAAPDERLVGRVTANIYAWNTFGAIAGSILAAFVLIPALQFSGALKLAVLLNLALALVAATISDIPRLKRPIVATGLLTIAAAAFAFSPDEPKALVAASAISFDARTDERSVETFYEVGRSTTVHVSELDGRYYIKTNGLPEAQVEFSGSARVRNSQVWLGALPFIARPDAETALIVGYGGGRALEGIPPGYRQIDAIELEPAVIRANQSISQNRDDDPLNDERVNIIINDARSALSLTSKTYDVIVSQPSHPWTSGASHLYTSEFIALAKSRLSEDGVYLQWINSSFVTEPLLASLSRTLKNHFRYVHVYQPDPTDLFFLASDVPLNEFRNFSETITPDENLLSHFAGVGLPAIEDLVAAYALGDEGVAALAAKGQVNTDDRNLMATWSRPQADGLDAVKLEKVFVPLDPLLNPDSALRRELIPNTNLVYLTQRLISVGFESRALDFGKSLSEAADRQIVRAMGLRFHGRSEQATGALIASLEQDPENPQTLYSLIQPRLGQLAADRAPEPLVVVADQLTGSARAVLVGWKFGYLGDWDSLRNLEQQLASAAPSDAWRPEATKLRVNWRMQAAIQGGQPEYAREAIKILDDQLATYQTAELFAMRAACALILKDTKRFAESIRSVAHIYRDQIEEAERGFLYISETEKRQMEARLSGMISEAEKFNATRADPQLKSALENLQEARERLATVQ